MAVTNHNLYFSGGTCPPFSECPEDWFDPSKRAVSTSGLGSKPKYTFGIADVMKDNIWPAPEIEKMDNNSYSIDCIRMGSSFAINRHFDFRCPPHHKFRMDKGHNKQQSLWKWFCENFDELDVGACLWMVHVPKLLTVEGIFWCVTNPVDGLEFSIVEKFTEAEIAAGLDGSDPEEGGHFPVPVAEQFNKECNRIYGIRIDAMPPANEDECKPGKGKLDGFSVQVSAKGCCPFGGY